ncbi:hypothetical protein [Aureimonas glaciei]|uniref:Uncharacterized protein n=1 Tax=Aureimonas glaciei TaxID=1776957 RepID=A0A916Y334_9HYPH|nr:hypothetical protein [Aureimonas glaciei]GGD29206.1 hypothetical protein GCM10011335_35430 [Aureimonas glaciei]
MAAQPPYTNGTATVTAGSAVVTGTGTAWNIGIVNGGDFSRLGLMIPILSVDSATQLTLAYPWAGATGTGAYAISIGRSGAADATTANARLAQLVAQLQGVSPFIQSLLDDADQAAARNTLGAAAPIGFTPIQQGGGPGQFANKTNIGWTGSALTLAIDNTLLGKMLVGGVNVSTFMEQLALNAANAAQARATLVAQENLGWKPCSGFPYSPASNVSGVIIPIPAGSKSLRVTGVAKPSVLSAFGFMRLSYDGGATYKAAATDYSAASFYHVGSAVAGSGDLIQSYFKCLVAANDAVLFSTFDARVDFFSSGLAKMMAWSAGFATSGASSYELYNGWSRTGGAPTHAILQLSEGASFTPSTNIMAECF